MIDFHKVEGRVPGNYYVLSRRAVPNPHDHPDPVPRNDRPEGASREPRIWHQARFIHAKRGFMPKGAMFSFRTLKEYP